MADALASLVENLHAREQIKELRARYGWYAARGDYEGIVSLYAPDGIFECLVDEKVRKRFQGREEILSFLKPSVVPGLVYPMIHNDIIEVNGDEAIGSCMMESRCAAEHLPAFGGYYHDRAKKIDGKWLFIERRYFRYYPQFERSGLDEVGKPETGLALQHNRTT